MNTGEGAMGEPGHGTAWHLHAVCVCVSWLLLWLMFWVVRAQHQQSPCKYQTIRWHHQDGAEGVGLPLHLRAGLLSPGTAIKGPNNLPKVTSEPAQ